MKEDHIKDINALITSALSFAVSFGLDIPEDAAKIFGSLSPVIQQTINKVLTVFLKKDFSRIECARLGICYQSFVECVWNNETSGGNLNNSFFSQSQEYGKIDEITEAALRAAMNDSQNIKSHHYGRLLGNVLYQTKYDESSVYTLLRIAQLLSYDELCLLAVLNELPAQNYEGLVRVDDKRAELAVNMLNLKNSALVKRVPNYTVGATLDNLQISSLGIDLYRLMGLRELDSTTTNDLKRLLLSYLQS